jgi:hypothetical protein
MPEPSSLKKSISMPKSLLILAQQRAQSQSRNLSNYVQSLIRRDIERAKPRK